MTALTRSPGALAGAAGTILAFYAARSAQPSSAACSLGNPSGTTSTILFLTAAALAGVTAYLSIAHVRHSANSWLWSALGGAALIAVPVLLFAADLAAHPCAAF